MDAAALEARHFGEVACRDFRESVLAVLPHRCCLHKNCRYSWCESFCCDTLSKVFLLKRAAPMLELTRGDKWLQSKGLPGLHYLARGFFSRPGDVHNTVYDSQDIYYGRSCAACSGSHAMCDNHYNNV